MPKAAKPPSASLTPELLGQLLGLLAHDLRNPLAAIQSNIGFIGSVPDPKRFADEVLPRNYPEEVTEALADVTLSCEEMTHIIDNFQALSYLLNGQPELNRAPVLLTDVVVDAVARAAGSARSHSVTVAIQRADSPLVRAHPDMLQRAVANLVRNAISHAPASSTVNVLVSTRTGSGCVRVEDSGLSLEADFIAEAFTAGGQLRCKSTPRGRYSRGLGLFVAGVSARAAGGEIRVVSAPGSATNAFELTLDLARP